MSLLTEEIQQKTSNPPLLKSSADIVRLPALRVLLTSPLSFSAAERQLWPHGPTWAAFSLCLDVIQDFPAG